jgi:hypothetical protein
MEGTYLRRKLSRRLSRNMQVSRNARTEQVPVLSKCRLWVLAFYVTCLGCGCKSKEQGPEVSDWARVIEKCEHTYAVR